MDGQDWDWDQDWDDEEWDWDWDNEKWAEEEKRLAEEYAAGLERELLVLLRPFQPERQCFLAHPVRQDGEMTGRAPRVSLFRESRQPPPA